MTSSPETLEKSLGYRFDDPNLLKQALTHCSAGSRNNERLEFLGDALLGCVIAAELFDRHRKAREGELSRLRASLVRRESLAEMAAELDIGRHLRLGAGERKSGGHSRNSILADALEAVAAYSPDKLESLQQHIDPMWIEEALAWAGTASMPTVVSN